ncbi:unnamed protein product [Cylicostephanus goldi]|uniref:Uncharacterized protein n=1 Tax=Cylicostephanus goldi TaxID=71465 RepID=A0A3P7M9J3_CYLGO|nr:unnamed protein product [Cylicostephanus goldi]
MSDPYEVSPDEGESSKWPTNAAPRPFRGEFRQIANQTNYPAWNPYLHTLGNKLQVLKSHSVAEGLVPM